MYSIQYIKSQNLRAAAAAAQRDLRPLVLSASDREIFPPVNTPLPYLRNRTPKGWSYQDSILVGDGSSSAPAQAKSWRQLCEWLAGDPDAGYAITDSFQRDGCYVVSRFQRDKEESVA